MTKKFIFIIIISLLFTTPIYAEDVTDDITSSIKGELSDFKSSLPDYILDYLPDELFNEDFSDLHNGKIDHNIFLNSALNSALAEMPNILRSTSILLVMIVIISIFNTMSRSFESGTLKNVYLICSSLCISLSIYSFVTEMSNSAISYMKSLCSVMNAFTPIMTVLQIMNGQISTAALSNTSMMLFISVIENVLVYLMNPIVRLCICFSIVKAINNSIDIGGIVKFIKGSFITLTVFTMMIFNFVFSFQNTLTQSADSLGMKTAKFAIGSFIPIVGPSINEALRTVTSSISYIKNSCGVIAMIALVLLTLPIVISFYLKKKSLDICASISSMLGCDKESALISEASGICSFILALVSCTSIFFILSLTIFIKTSVI